MEDTARSADILIVGLGNQGKRRAKALLSVGYGCGGYDITSVDAPEGLRMHRRFPGGFPCVIISTPPDSHVEVALEAIEKGARRLLIEKPLAWELVDAIRLADLGREKQIEITVAAPWIQAPVLQVFRSIVNMNGLGERLSLVSRTECNIEHWPPATYRTLNSSFWFYMDVGAHLLYLAEFLSCRKLQKLEVIPGNAFFDFYLLGVFEEGLHYTAKVDAFRAVDSQIWQFHASGGSCRIEINFSKVGESAVESETLLWARGQKVGISIEDALRHLHFLLEAEH